MGTRQQERRNAEIVRLREEEGRTLDEIAARYGITRERVRQIVLDTDSGLAREVRHDRIDRREEEILWANRELITSLYMNNHEMKMKDLAREFDVRIETMKTWIRENVSQIDRRRKAARNAGKYQHVDYVAWMKRFAKEHDGKTPSINAWHRWTAKGKPEAAGIVFKYGSWSKACEAAGLVANNPAPGRQYFRQYDRYDCIDAIRACGDELGKLPNTLEYQAWCRGIPERPSLVIVCMRIGGDDNGRVPWLEALDIAYGDDNGTV